MDEPSGRALGEILGIGDRVKHTPLGIGTVVGGDEGSLTIRLDAGRTVSVVRSFAGLCRLSQWEEGRVSPPWSLILDGYFSPPLHGGEMALLRFLDAHLDPNWRIYVRPHLDAERPLLAAIHPRLGGVIWDVVEWDLANVEDRGKTWCIKDGLGERLQESPFNYLDSIRSKLYGVYLPEIGERLMTDERAFGLVRAGLYWHGATTRQLRERFGDQRISVFGDDALRRESLGLVVPNKDGNWMEPGWFDQFDQAFGHSFRMPDPLTALRPTKSQQKHVEPKKGVHLIEGVAGSGKSVVLAYRAARIANEGRRVLVLTFNRTLTNYLRALLERVPVRRRPDLITVLHYHEMLGRIFNEYADWPKRTEESDDDSGDTGNRFDRDWPEHALRLLETGGVPERLRYDAVLVDEGQDFSSDYLQVVHELVDWQNEPEVVIAYDRAQRIYGRSPAVEGSESWLAGLRPEKLREGLRLPATIADAATAFAQRWTLSTTAISGRPAGLLPEEGGVWWCPTRDEATAGAAALSLFNTWKAEPGFRAGRCAIVVPSRSFGCAFVRLLNESGVSVNHVFPVRSGDGLLDSVIDEGDGAPDWLVASKRKRAFAYSDTRVKVSTVHSFKGWDAERVIYVLTSPKAPTPRGLAEAFVGITRSDSYAAIVGVGDAMCIGELGLPTLNIPIDEPVRARFIELLETAQRPPATSVRRGRTPGREAHRQPGDDKNGYPAGEEPPPPWIS